MDEFRQALLDLRISMRDLILDPRQWWWHVANRHCHVGRISEREQVDYVHGGPSV